MPKIADRLSVASARKTPWDGLGVKLEGEDVQGWLEQTGLNWQAKTATVKFAPEVNDQGAGRLLAVDNRRVLFRDDTNEPLAIVSDDYEAHQPKDVLEFFRETVQKFGAFRLDFAGMLNRGKKIWALAKGTDEVNLAGVDGYARYLLVGTSFDLSMNTVVRQVSVRTSCMNQLRALQHGGKLEGGVRVMHRMAFDKDEVNSKMNFDAEWREFTNLVERLSQKKVDEETARQFFLRTFFPKNDEGVNEASMKSRERRVDDMLAVYHNAPGQELSTARGTAWGLVNAVTYFYDHASGARTDDSRIDRAWFGEGDTVKARAFDLALSLN